MSTIETDPGCASTNVRSLPVAGSKPLLMVSSVVELSASHQVSPVEPTRRLTRTSSHENHSTYQPQLLP
jgi:hypothetical protein